MKVLFFNELFDLSIPANADKFLAYFQTRENAEACDWGEEFDYANEIVDVDYYDKCHSTK